MVDLEKIEQALNSDPASRQHFSNDPAGFLLGQGLRVSQEQAAQLRHMLFQARAKIPAEQAQIQLMLTPICLPRMTLPGPIPRPQRIGRFSRVPPPPGLLLPD